MNKKFKFTLVIITVMLLPLLVKGCRKYQKEIEEIINKASKT